MKNAWVVDLGLMEYGAAWELQKRLAAARKADAVPDVLLVCEHPHVITLGRNGKVANLRAPGHVLRQMNVSFFETNRGGDITYHGPGQLVGYPILNLAEIRRDVAWYVRSLEETMMRTTTEFGVATKRVPGRTGVWADVTIDVSANVESETADAHDAPELRKMTDEEKLAAIGVHLSRWVTSHGFAYNISTDLRYFDLIVPCGIAGKRATSLEKLLGRRVEMGEVAPRMATHFGQVLGLNMRETRRDELDSALATFERHAAFAVV